MKPTSRLTLDFAQRMVNDLATNNVLRGSWAEQLVAHYLGLTDLPPNWSYYDMRDVSGREISVKHSVGPRASFVVTMNQWAWDHELHAAQPVTEGWRGGEAAEPQYWCHAYVFAWLDCDSSAPSLDIVLNSELWMFATLSRADMYRNFVLRRAQPQKSIGLSGLRGLTSFVHGSELAASVGRIRTTDTDGVPPRRMDIRPVPGIGEPVEVGEAVVLPESVVG